MFWRDNPELKSEICSEWFGFTSCYSLRQLSFSSKGGSGKKEEKNPCKKPCTNAGNNHFTHCFDISVMTLASTEVGTEVQMRVWMVTTLCSLLDLDSASTFRECMKSWHKAKGNLSFVFRSWIIGPKRGCGGVLKRGKCEKKKLTVVFAH